MLGTAGLAPGQPADESVAAEALRRAAAGLRAAYADRAEPGDAADMAACALQGEMSLANAKLGAVHSLARVVAGTAHVPHGIACAALLTPVIETNVRALLTGQPAPSIRDGRP